MLDGETRPACIRELSFRTHDPRDKPSSQGAGDRRAQRWEVVAGGQGPSSSAAVAGRVVG